MAVIDRREYQKAYYRRNRKRHLAVVKAYNEAHKDEIAEYRATHDRREYFREYYVRNAQRLKLQRVRKERA